MRYVHEVFDRLSAFIDTVYVVGDVNVHLERQDDPVTRDLIDGSLASLLNCVTSPMHKHGGKSDIVACRFHFPLPCVNVIDVELSDHHLLRWSVPTTRKPPVQVSTSRRPRKKLDSIAFQSVIAASLLCDAQAWLPLDIDSLAKLYDTEIASILNRLVPMRCRRRAPDAWFDDDCRSAKSFVRLFERDIRCVRRRDPSHTVAIADAAAVWSERRREYCVLLQHKTETSWQVKLMPERSTPQLLWRCVDVLLGCGRAQSSSSVTADAVHAFFNAKVTGVRCSTNDAPPPVLTDAPPDCSLMDFLTLSANDVFIAVRQPPDKQ